MKLETKTIPYTKPSLCKQFIANRCTRTQDCPKHTWNYVKIIPRTLIGCHDDVIKWKHLPLYWPFVQGIHRSPVNSPHKGQWRGALIFSLICVCINGWVNNGEAGDLRRYRAHYDVIVMHWRKSFDPGIVVEIRSQRNLYKMYSFTNSTVHLDGLA